MSVESKLYMEKYAYIDRALQYFSLKCFPTDRILLCIRVRLECDNTCYCQY